MIIGSALQPDVQLLVASMFTQIAGQTRMHLARIRVGELPDPTYDDGFE